MVDPIKSIVVDTSVLYAAASPYELDEIKALAPAEIVVPFTDVAELDQLMQRTRERDRARAALNVLKAQVARGAARGPVTCGSGLTIRIASAEQETPPPHLPGLDARLADDRILACAANIALQGEVTLATTEFALFVKSEACGIDGLYLDRYAEVNTVATRRERTAFESAWNRLCLAQDTWAACRRALTFLRTPLVARLLVPVRQTRAPSQVHDVVARFDALNAQWTESTNLNTILAPTLRLMAPPAVNHSVAMIPQPIDLSAPLGSHTRRETPEERAIRIKSEEALARGREEFNLDVVLSWVEMVREYVLEQVGDDV